MPFILPSPLKEFFLINHILELEEILSAQDRALLLSNSDHSWTSGYNLWKTTPSYRKILRKIPLATLASALFNKQLLRLAFTRTFSITPNSTCPFSQSRSLEEICSITPLLGGVFLCLESPENAVSPGSLPSLLEQSPGHAIFFSANYPIPFPELFQKQGLKTLLICFSPPQSRYAFRDSDPETHNFKRQGYVFGDLLSEEDVPYLHQLKH